MKSQTGGAISMGVEILYGKVSKQKLNVKSLTETELVGNIDYLPYNICFMIFMGKDAP